jgi:hypothetical protein
LVYKVFALDLDQRASTIVLPVPNLPSDLAMVITLPLPVGGFWTFQSTVERTGPLALPDLCTCWRGRKWKYIGDLDR